MADARQEDKAKQGLDESARRAGEKTADQTKRMSEAATHTSEQLQRGSEKTAEQTRRIGETAAQTTDQLARVSADLFQHNTELLQSALKFNVDMASSVFGRSTDQVSRTLGLSSGDEVEKATERSTRNTMTVLQSSAVAAREMSGMSREYFDLVRQQVEGTMKRMGDLWSCRTPHDFAAVHSELVRETMETAVQSSKKMADMSLKAAEKAAKHISENTERNAA